MASAPPSRVFIPWNGISGTDDKAFTLSMNGDCRGDMNLRITSNWLGAIEDNPARSEDGRLIIKPYVSGDMKEAGRRMTLLKKFRDVLNQEAYDALMKEVLYQMYLEGLCDGDESAQINKQEAFRRVIASLSTTEDVYGVIDKLYKSIVLVSKGTSWVQQASLAVMQKYKHVTFELGCNGGNKSLHFIETIFRGKSVKTLYTDAARAMDKRLCVSFRFVTPKPGAKSDANVAHWEQHLLPLDIKSMKSSRSNDYVWLRWTKWGHTSSASHQYQESLRVLLRTARLLNRTPLQICDDVQQLARSLRMAADPSGIPPVPALPPCIPPVPDLGQIVSATQSEEESEMKAADDAVDDYIAANGELMAPTAGSDEVITGISGDKEEDERAETEKLDETAADDVKFIVIANKSCPKFCDNVQKDNGMECNAAMCLDCFGVLEEEEKKNTVCGEATRTTQRSKAGTNNKKRDAEKISLPQSKNANADKCHLDHGLTKSYVAGDKDYITGPWAKTQKKNGRDLPSECIKCGGIFVTAHEMRKRLKQ